MANIESLTIVGASSNPEKFGHKALRKAILDKERVYAVNPNGKSITLDLGHGSRIKITPYLSINDTPEPTSHVFFYMPRKFITESHAIQCNSKGIETIIIPPRSDGVFNPEDEETVKIIKFFTDHNYQRDQIIIDACYLQGM